MVYFLTFFPPENSNVFLKSWPFLYGACWSAGRWWLVDGICSLRPCVAGIVPLCTYICNNSSLKKREVFPFFLLFLSAPFVYSSLIWYLVSMYWTEWSTIPAGPGLVCSFDRGSIEWTDSSKVCVWFLCMYVLSCLCVGTSFVDWLDKGFMCGRSFEM